MVLYIILAILAAIVLLIWREIKRAPWAPDEYDDLIKTHGPKAMTPEDLQLEKEIDAALSETETMELAEEINKITKSKNQ